MGSAVDRDPVAPNRALWAAGRDPVALNRVRSAVDRDPVAPDRGLSATGRDPVALNRAPSAVDRDSVAPKPWLVGCGLRSSCSESRFIRCGSRFSRSESRFVRFGSRVGGSGTNIVAKNQVIDGDRGELGVAREASRADMVRGDRDGVSSGPTMGSLVTHDPSARATAPRAQAHARRPGAFRSRFASPTFTALARQGDAASASTSCLVLCLAVCAVRGLAPRRSRQHAPARGARPVRRGRAAHGVRLS